MARRANSGKYSKFIYFIELEPPFSHVVYGPFNSRPTRQLKMQGEEDGMCKLITYELDENLNYIRK